MLGSAVRDEHGIEGDAGETPGLDLLPITTHLAREKELAQVCSNGFSRIQALV